MTRRALALLLVSACAAPDAGESPSFGEVGEARAKLAEWRDMDRAELVEFLKERLAAFDARVAEERAAFRALPADPDDVEWVRQNLAHMVAIDQLGRSELMMPLAGLRGASLTGDEMATTFAVTSRLSAVDAANTAALKLLLERHGWIDVSTFGAEADGDAFLIAQHADADRDFQRAVLAVLEERVASGETKPSNYAYLYDRVAVAEKRPQRYGTQGRCTGEGRWEPFELEDPERVDELRASVGLPTLAEYVALASTLCP